MTRMTGTSPYGAHWDLFAVNAFSAAGPKRLQAAPCGSKALKPRKNGFAELKTKEKPFCCDFPNDFTETQANPRPEAPACLTIA